MDYTVAWHAIPEKINNSIEDSIFFCATSPSFCSQKTLFRPTSTYFCRYQITFCATSNFIIQHKMVFLATLS